MKPAALLLLFLASCAAIVGDDYVVVHDEPEPEVVVPASCVPITASCTDSYDCSVYYCEFEAPDGCSPWQHDEPGNECGGPFFFCCPEN